MIELGQKVRDKVTGFTGIATSKVIYLNGCVQFHVRPRMTTPKEGETPKYPEGSFIDAEQLEVLEKGVEAETKDTGGGVREYPDD